MRAEQVLIEEGVAVKGALAQVVLVDVPFGGKDAQAGRLLLESAKAGGALVVVDLVLGPFGRAEAAGQIAGDVERVLGVDAAGLGQALAEGLERPGIPDTPVEQRLDTRGQLEVAAIEQGEGRVVGQVLEGERLLRLGMVQFHE